MYILVTLSGEQVELPRQAFTLFYNILRTRADEVMWVDTDHVVFLKDGKVVAEYYERPTQRKLVLRDELAVKIVVREITKLARVARRILKLRSLG